MFRDEHEQNRLHDDVRLNINHQNVIDALQSVWCCNELNDIMNDIMNMNSLYFYIVKVWTQKDLTELHSLL